MKNLAEFEIGVFTVSQVTEFIQFWDHLADAFQHVVPVKTIERVWKIQFDDDVVSGYSWKELSGGMDGGLTSACDADSDLERVAVVCQSVYGMQAGAPGPNSLGV